jgi:hypothetical protein
MNEMSQQHPVWVAENHINPCNSAFTIPYRETLSVGKAIGKELNYSLKCSQVSHYSL